MSANARMTRGRPGRSFFLCALFGASGAWAFGSGPAQAAGAVAIVASEAARSLGSVAGRSIVVAAPLTSDEPSPRGDELAVEVASLLASRIGGGAQPHPKTAPLAAARAIAGRASALVFVRAAIALGDMRVSVDVYPPMANAWDRIRDPLPAPTAHAFATAKIDAEVRAFLPALLLEQASVGRFRHDEGDVIAAACGDVDGDGGNELVVVSRTRVTLGRLRGGAFVANRAALWSALAAPAPVPMREPLGGAVIADGRVYVGSTDYGSLSLGPDLEIGAPLAGLPAWGGEQGLVCLNAEPSAGAFDGAPIYCALSRDPKLVMAVPAPRFDAFAAASLVGVDGAGMSVLVLREPSGKVRFRVGGELAVPDETFGAQIVVGDLDQDGRPDLVTTRDGPDDAITIHHVDPTTGQTEVVLRTDAPAPIRALAVCPPEVGGAPALVAVVGAEIWLVRAAHGGDR